MTQSGQKIRALVWNEYHHELHDERVRKIYPDGIHEVLARALRESGAIEVATATLNDAEQGLTEDALAAADVLMWWGHVKHDDVDDKYVPRVVKRVRDEGMGFVPLHAAFRSKPFIALMRTDCNIGGWREEGEWEKIKVVSPEHPVARGISDFTLPHTEMYKEPLGIPQPDTVVFHSTFEGGEEFRSGCAFTIGKGRVFYFRPGHETYPIFYEPVIKKILVNAVMWTAGRT